MPINKIDNTKFFINSSQPANTENKPNSQAPATQDEKMSDAVKYMLGATALAATVALGIAGHKYNWGRGAKNLAQNNAGEIKVQPHSNNTGGHNTEHSLNTSTNSKNLYPNRNNNQSQLSKLKDTLTSPFKKIKERRKTKQLAKENAEKLKKEKIQKELQERQKQADLATREAYAKDRQRVLEDTPNRRARIAQKEAKYADRVKNFEKKDFGDINTEHVLEDYNYKEAKKYLQTNPEYFAPAPKKGEYDLRHIAVDGYWNGPKGLGASIGTRIPGTELHYSNQFTLHDRSYPQLEFNKLTKDEFRNTHWALQKVAIKGLYNTDKKIHIGTVLRFSAPECAVESSRPLGWNIFIEGDISLEKMSEIKQQLVNSGALARQIAIQDNDTMLEVFNEIIKCLNK